MLKYVTPKTFLTSKFFFFSFFLGSNNPTHETKSSIAYCLNEFNLMKTYCFLTTMIERERERKIVKTCYKFSNYQNKERSLQ